MDEEREAPEPAGEIRELERVEEAASCCGR
jgi:hypothetical protein